LAGFSATFAPCGEIGTLSLERRQQFPYEAFDVTVQRSPACTNKRDQSRDGEFRLAVAGMPPGGGMLADGKLDMHQL